MKKIVEVAALAALGAAFASNGYAADAAAPTTDAASAEGATTFEDIVVTATKRETKLQDTPIAITVLNPTALKDSHVLSLLNLGNSVPALRVATFEARQSSLTVGMRGIVPFDQNQTAREPGVGTYVDGVYLGRSQGLNSALFDVQRIEVLRGPQGTLFGRNTEGGALSIVTKAPTGKMDGRVVAGFGNYGQYTSELHQNLPEFYNLSIKFDGVIQHQDATTKNPLEGQAGWNQFHRAGGRLQALWKPTDKLSADFSIDYADDKNTPFYSQLVSYNPFGKRVRALSELTAAVSPAPSNPLAPNFAAVSAPAGTINPLSPLIKVHTSRQTVSDIGAPQQESEDQTFGSAVTVKYAVAPNLELRSITAYRGVATNQWDNSGIGSRNVFVPNTSTTATPIGGSLFGRYSLSDLYQNQFSQEFQAVGDFGPTFNYVVGVYYFTEHVKESAATPFSNQWNADGTAYSIRSENGVLAGTTTLSATNAQGWQYGTRVITRRTRADNDSTAIFGQGTWSPIDPLHITVGGRYTHDTRDGNQDRANNQPVNNNLSYDDSRFDPMVTVAYDYTKDINVYAKYATGFRAGGANARSVDFSSKFDPEESKSYELGLKSELFNRSVLFNAAVYHTDLDSQQIDFDQVLTSNLVVNGVTVATAGTHFEETRNAKGTSKIDGVELDATWNVNDNLRVGGSYAYTKVKIPAAPYPFAPGNGLNTGDPFPVVPIYTPENAGSAFIDYDMPFHQMNLHTHLDASYSDGQYSFPTEFADTFVVSGATTTSKTIPVAQKGDSSFIVNGSIALENISVKDGAATAKLSLWARNLLDEEHIYRISAANRGTIGDYANFNPPRTYGIELSLSY